MANPAAYRNPGTVDSTYTMLKKYRFVDEFV